MVGRGGKVGGVVEGGKVDWGDWGERRGESSCRRKGRRLRSSTGNRGDDGGGAVEGGAGAGVTTGWVSVSVVGSVGGELDVLGEAGSVLSVVSWAEPES